MQLAQMRRLSSSLLVTSLTVVLLVRSVEAALVPATFDEYVGISAYSIQGGNLADPETLSMMVTQDQTGGRGEGTGFASASGVLPLPTELDLSISGGNNLSGIGGTATVLIQYQFSLAPLGDGLPDVVPITLTTSGWVDVDTSLSDGFIQGQTFARITYPGGQVQATNQDAQGGHEGYFSFDRTIPLNVAAGAAQSISIYLTSHGQGAGSDFFYHGHAFLDPIIQIDANFAFKDHFELVYSPGIIIPEPGTLLLATLAVGQWGVVRKRRRHFPSAPE